MDKSPILISGAPTTRSLWPLLAEKHRLVFIYPQAVQSAGEMGITDASAIAQYVDGHGQDHARNVGALLSARVVNALPQITRRMAQAYGDAHPPAMLNSQMPAWWPGFIHERLTTAAGVVTALDRAGDKNQFAGLVVHEDVTLDMRAAVAWARARSVPSIHIPHAPCHLLPGTHDIHAEVRADYVAASGQYESEFYGECGAANISVTGNPALDYLYETGAIPERDEARRVLALPADARVLVYATTWGQTTSLRSTFGNEFNAGLRAVVAFAKANDSILIIKMHPNQDPNDANEFVKVLQESETKGLVTREHITYCLRAADVLIAQSPSNLCVEAAILGTPSCYIQTEGFDYRHALPFRCGAENVADAIKAALDSRGASEWQDFAAYYNAAHPMGLAAERTCEFVESVCLTASL